MSNLLEQAAITNGEGLMEYENMMRIVENRIPYKGRSIAQWDAEVSLPQITDNMTLHQLEEYNQRFVNVSQIIMGNLSQARAGMVYAKNHMEISILREKKAIESRIMQWNSVATNTPKKKFPAKDVVNDRAMEANTDAISGHRVSEVFYEFWKTHHDRLRLIGDRLTSMNMLKNIESKFV